MTPQGTHLYRDVDDLPPLVARAVGLAEELDFGFSCRPPNGRLLQALAAGRPSGRFGETGTGCGVGVAWMVTGAGPDARVVSVEQDAERAAAVAELFADLPNVAVRHADWTELGTYGPFDLLFLDGGGKRSTDGELADPRTMLRPSGTMVLDDFTASDEWPPRFGGEVDRDRLHWLEHPDLLATEVPVGPDARTVLATLKPPPIRG